MKKYIHLIFMASIMLNACDKNEISTSTNVAEGARVKFIHATPGVPALDFFVNDTKVSPILSSSVTDNGILKSVTTGVSYLSTFPSNEYALIGQGNNNIKINTSVPIPALVTPQTINENINVNSQTLNTTNSGYYSIFTTGYPDNVEALVIEDKFDGTSKDVAYVRLINLSPTAPALDLGLKYTPAGSSTATELLPITNIAYKGNSGFKPVPAAINGTGYTFQTKLTGTATTLGAVIPSTGTTTLTPGRYYTIFARGLTVDYVVANKGITLKASTRPTAAVTQPEIYYNPYGLTFYTNK